MVFYIEYVLLDNFIMDYVIINLIEITYKFQFKKINKMLSCVLGSLLALLLPYIYGKLLLLNIYRLFIAIFMVLLLRKYKNCKQFITYLILFFSYTFLLGGLSFGIISMLKIDYTLSGVMFYSFEFPISIFILLIYACIRCVKRLIKKTSKDIELSNYLCPITIYNNDKKVDGVGFYDSGNRLEVEGVGVSIITMSMFLKLYGNLPIEKVLLRDIDGLNLKGAKYIDIEGLNKNGSYLSFFIDKMRIGNEDYNNVRVAVTLKNFDKFDCILNSNLVLNKR